MSDPGLIMVAEIHGLAGREPELGALLSELTDSASREAGYSSFRALPAGRPGEFVVLAAWQDERALREHYGTVAYRRYRGAVEPLLARPSDVVIHHISTTSACARPQSAGPGDARLSGRQPRAGGRPAMTSSSFCARMGLPT